MSKLVLENNDFLRQFEVIFNEKMARIKWPGALEFRGDGSVSSLAASYAMD